MLFKKYTTLDKKSYIWGDFLHCPKFALKHLLNDTLFSLLFIFI